MSRVRLLCFSVSEIWTLLNGREFQKNPPATLNLAIANCANNTISPRLPTALWGSPGSHVNTHISVSSSTHQQLHNRTLPRRLEHLIPTRTTQHATKSNPELSRSQKEFLRCDQASQRQDSMMLYGTAIVAAYISAARGRMSQTGIL